MRGVGVVVFLGSAAIGLLVAQWLLPGVSIAASGFVTVVVVFAVVQSVLSPFIGKVVAQNASAFLGGVGLVSTLVALVIASLVGGLSIDGWRTWILATLVVWLVTAVATLVLPLVVLRNKKSGA